MNKLCFAQFNDAYPPVTDGVVTCVRNYAHWLNRKYGDCTLFVPDKKGVSYEESFRVVGYRSVPLPGRPPYRVGIPELDSKYRSELKNLRIDLVHTHSPFSAGAEALRVGRERKIPVVATFHSKYYDDFYAYTKSKLLSLQGVRIVVRRLEQMDSVWTVSDATANTLRAYGYKGRITVIPNGSDLLLPSDTVRLRLRAREAGDWGDVPMLLFVGQHIWQKNIGLIVKACKLVSDQQPFAMMMVGDGAAHEQLVALVEKEGLSHRFLFPGVVRDRELLASLYYSARALVFPSLYDNAPLVVGEAAALGCPCIAISGSNTAQNIRHLQNGILCENNAQSLAEQMAFALQAPEQCKRIGNNARQTLSRSWESIVDQAYQTYREILGQHARHTVV